METKEERDSINARMGERYHEKVIQRQLTGI